MQTPPHVHSFHTANNVKFGQQNEDPSALLEERVRCGNKLTLHFKVALLATIPDRYMHFLCSFYDIIMFNVFARRMHLLVILISSRMSS